MAAPVDPFPDFKNLIDIPDANLVNARFRRLYDAADKTKTGLDAQSFKDGAFTAAKFPAAQAWQTVAFVGGFGFSPGSLSFYKDQIGIVRTRPEGFTIPAQNTIPTGSLIATLPSGYRPPVLIYITCWNVTQTPVWASIDTDGSMRIVDGIVGNTGGSSLVSFIGSWQAA